MEGFQNSNNVVDFEAARAEQEAAQETSAENPEIVQLKQEISAFKEVLEGYEGENLTGDQLQAADAMAFALMTKTAELEVAKLKELAANDNPASQALEAAA